MRKTSEITDDRRAWSNKILNAHIEDDTCLNITGVNAPINKIHRIHQTMS